MFIFIPEAFSGSEDLELLEPYPDVEQSRFFQKLVGMDEENKYFEKSKMDYLLNRVKKSKYQFIRNDEYFSSHRAAIHLKWKFLRNKQQVKTAKDFISIVAGRSKMSGKPYLVVTEEKGIYQLREILENELEFLENSLDQAKKMKEKETIKETSKLAEVPLDTHE